MKQKQKQVEKLSGEQYRINLDRIGMMCLADARKLHNHSNNGNRFSNSVIVRRAVRFYLEHLKSLNDFSIELIETQRAAKGVY